MKKTLLTSLFALTAASGASALTAEEVLATSADSVQQGLAIAKEADERDFGFGSSEVESVMTLKNSHGDTSIRKMRQKTFEMEDMSVGDKSIIVFDQPRDVKGTGFLTHSNILDPDKQWMFLPALKRVKRISSKNKSGPFMGSEFAYEDLGSQEVGKYDYKYLRTEACPELETEQCFVVERTPNYKYSGYTKMIGWIDTKEFRGIQIDFYDMKNELLKSLKNKGYQKYAGKFWRPDRMEMVNHQNGKNTAIDFQGYNFDVKFKENEFTKSKLKNVR